MTVLQGSVASTRSVEKPGWLRQAWVVFRKEVRIELRTRQALGATFLFALVTLCVLAYLLALKSVRLDVDSALLWILLFFSAMSGLSRVFVREEEMATADALRLTVRPSALYAGKLFFNWALLVGIEIVTAPLLFIALGAPLGDAMIGLLVLILFLGGIGLAAGSTFVAALVAPATSGGIRSSLFLAIAFPVLVPLLLSATSATVAALSPASVPPGTAGNECIVLASYDAVVITASFLLFGFVWNTV
jgi:heme exporter protein B